MENSALGICGDIKSSLPTIEEDCKKIEELAMMLKNMDISLDEICERLSKGRTDTTAKDIERFFREKMSNELLTAIAAMRAIASQFKMDNVTE